MLERQNPKQLPELLCLWQICFSGQTSYRRLISIEGECNEKSIFSQASVEAMLKTAMQSQLDGVRTGLGQLQAALVDLREIKTCLSDMELSLVRVPELSERLYECREEYVRHSQYAAAMENLKHIFTVPESVEKTHKWIAEGRLLYAHQCLMDLENSRDDLLFELHKLPHQNPNDTRMLKEYFADVQKLSDDLGKQVWIILQRTLNTVRKEPTQIVTALRIVEREERADQFALQRQKGSGFLPPGRPKKWREKALLVLEGAAAQRIEGNMFEDREASKNWLIKHLEVIRLLLLEDMKVIRSLCVPCFPPHYDITNHYVQMYHKSLANHLVETIEGGLEDNEYVTLLSWVLNVYGGKELMGHPSLNINVGKLGPLLDNKILEDLVSKYLKNVNSNYDSWMSKALEIEEKEWYRSEPPQQDADSHYKTELPQLIHDMIRQNLDVAATISSDVQVQVLISSLEQVRFFAAKFQAGVTRYKDTYYADRSKIQYFTTYIIALANSCQGLVDVMVAIKSQFWKPGGSTQNDAKIATEFDALLTVYQRLRDLMCDHLLEEALVDLQEQFNSLLTAPWLTNTEPMDTICLTLSDYFNDYSHLHQKNFDHVVQLALNTVTMRYTTAILQKRLTPKTQEDRKLVADRITAEALKLSSVFEQVAPDLVKFDSPCEVMKGLAEVVKVSDVEFISLELHRLLRRYPDMTGDHLTALLMLRGDLGRLDVRQRVAEIMEEMRTQRAGPAPKSIFSHIHLSTSLFP
ncbi:exocyst complex component 3 isoform X1 [Procambarus clarkii]|uniref:exocyst complex component 3 isoform X1 n=1 Tax=Procambarus clarkii TaxID=6728 RepID=UPI001E673F07|nr:exocyst complex component 3-like isoform X1 [Procambarus clarkii]